MVERELIGLSISIYHREYIVIQRICTFMIAIFMIEQSSVSRVSVTGGGHGIHAIWISCQTDI